MNKKYLLGVLALLVFIPQVTFAVWWNPGTWFNNWNFGREKFQQTEVFENRVINLENEVAQVNQALLTEQGQAEDVAIVEVAPVEEVKTVAPAAKPVTIVDVCLNIEGIQTFAPTGFSVSSNICTLIPVIDICPNIIGVQDKVPLGKKLYKNTSECLTLDEIDLLEEGNSQNSNSYQSSKNEAKEIQCENTKEEVIELTNERVEIRTEYLKEYEYKKSNPQGMGSSGVEADLKKLNEEYSKAVDPIDQQLSVLQVEIQLYCD